MFGKGPDAGTNRFTRMLNTMRRRPASPPAPPAPARSDGPRGSGAGSRPMVDLSGTALAGRSVQSTGRATANTADVARRDASPFADIVLPATDRPLRAIPEDPPARPAHGPGAHTDWDSAVFDPNGTSLASVSSLTEDRSMIDRPAMRREEYVSDEEEKRSLTAEDDRATGGSPALAADDPVSAARMRAAAEQGDNVREQMTGFDLPPRAEGAGSGPDIRWDGLEAADVGRDQTRYNTNVASELKASDPDQLRRENQLLRDVLAQVADLTERRDWTGLAELASLARDLSMSIDERTSAFTEAGVNVERIRTRSGGVMKVKSGGQVEI